MNERLPDWIRNKYAVGRGGMRSVKCSLRDGKLSTVCEEARCPNIGECFSRGTATFLILGKVCTRRCGFCDIRHGSPEKPDKDEPRRIAQQAKEMNLKHVVITSVSRDDLEDGGAEHFYQTVKEIRISLPQATIEVLTPDFAGSDTALSRVCEAKPHVFNHNVETVERLTETVRDGAMYRRSLDVLLNAKAMLGGGLTKSGIMLGLGESCEEVKKTLLDLRQSEVDIVTVGQYLRPSKKALPVVEYVQPERFEEISRLGERLGFKHTLSGPLVRSSYLADRLNI